MLTDFLLFKSIRSKLLILVLASVLPALGIILYSNFERQEQDLKKAEAEAMFILQSLSYDHENVVKVTRNFLMVLSKLPAVQNRNASACKKLFRELIKENTQYSTIIAADTKGRIFANPISSNSINIGESDFFQDVLDKKTFSVGNYILGRFSKRAILPFAYPVLDSKGRVTAVLIAGLDLVKYGRNFVVSSLLTEGSTLTILDRNFIRLFRHTDHEKYAGRSDTPEMVKQMIEGPQKGIFTAFGIDGVKRFFAYKRFSLRHISPSYLYLRIGIPYEQVLAPGKKIFLRNLCFLIGTLFIATLIAWFLGDMLIIKRLNKLIYTARQVGYGKFTTRTGIDYREGELGQLACTFDKMASALELRESESRQARQRLTESEIRYRITTELSNDGIAILSEGKYIYVNRKFLEIYGYDKEEEIIGKTLAATVHPDDLDMVLSYNLKRKKGESVPSNYELKALRKDGTPFFTEVSAAQGNHEGKSVTIASFRDTTERRNFEERLKTISVMDELTGLYNRRGFFKLANQNLKIAGRIKKPCLLFFIDLDKLKWINDTLGHQEGDSAIFETAVILKKTFRESDIIGRMGGDEFAVLAIDTNNESLDIFLKRLNKIIEDQNKSSERKYLLSLSIGTVQYDPEHPSSLDEMIAKADKLMYEDKKAKISLTTLAIENDNNL